MYEQLPKALYIHVPFCVRKCLYCDFTSYPYRERDARRYLSGLRREIELRSGKAGKRWALSTVFIGGGTPTCLSTEMLLEIINLINQYFILLPGVEFTIEANPGTVSLDKLAALRRAGVNRLSLGAQACSSSTLRTLGRIHSHGQTVSAVRWAREAGFANINVDLIFEVPGQTGQEWRQCLEQVVDLKPEHVSAYALQIETGTPLAAQVENGQLALCEEDTCLDMYHDAIDILNSAGLRQYEISNFALSGRECRHNLVYWHNGAYLGLGPAAHSRIKDRRTANEAGLDKYAAVLTRGMLPVACSERITPEIDIFETVFLGLRLTAGLDLERFRKRFGRPLEDVYPGVVRRMTEKALLEIKGNHLRLTGRGQAVANAVMAEFVPGDHIDK
ncbi:radical SAM family heme chaperone HemW [Desulfoscipio geothermicus]|uniref:Heme chaperone HemW n=1 Tax=Desulfoscipio geothermicus DSM 3669 TaxID=1121426 RepID=A0A1I6D2M4_9FIRM|nr:radical SAM family heme chaperone HemW [Desulfoscipio geothermicus]SFQ99734.1 oxygen-independent coproporphyrinogen-3 oxidase [Desulfoscipio geothermicus DSM 3669]